MNTYFKTRKIIVLIVIIAIVSITGISCDKREEKGVVTEDSTEKTDIQEKEEKITLTLFMSNSGVPAPEHVSVSDNRYINIVKDYANVDLEVEIPVYTDYLTKLNLLLASDNLPDIVHATSVNEALKRGDEGAFIDLYNYWENSEVIRKHIDEEKMEIAKSPGGGYFRIPARHDYRPEGGGLVSRFDLISKYNNGKWPETVEDWIETARRLKSDDPEAIPFSMRPQAGKFNNYGGAVFPYLYGARLDRWDYEENRVYARIQLPEYKAALETMAQLFKEGLLDPEFATQDDAGWFAKRDMTNCILAEHNSTNQTVPGLHSLYRKNPENPEQHTWQKLVAPPLKHYPDIVKDVKYIEPFKGTGINHGVFISSKCKHPDRAWRVLEGFASDELYEVATWGWEGETYKIENGKKIPDSAALLSEEYRYGRNYALICGYDHYGEATTVGARFDLGDEFVDEVESHIEVWDKVARDNGISPLTFVQYTDESKKKTAEANDEIFAISVEFVMGRIDSAEYDQRIDEWTKNYGFIYEEATKYINDNMDELKAMGCRFDR